jgi:hypothetical protein
MISLHNIPHKQVRNPHLLSLSTNTTSTIDEVESLTKFGNISKIGKECCNIETLPKFRMQNMQSDPALAFVKDTDQLTTIPKTHPYPYLYSKIIPFWYKYPITGYESNIDLLLSYKMGLYMERKY